MYNIAYNQGKQFNIIFVSYTEFYLLIVEIGEAGVARLGIIDCTRGSISSHKVDIYQKGAEKTF